MGRFREGHDNPSSRIANPSGSSALGLCAEDDEVDEQEDDKEGYAVTWKVSQKQ